MEIINMKHLIALTSKLQKFDLPEALDEPVKVEGPGGFPGRAV